MDPERPDLRVTAHTTMYSGHIWGVGVDIFRRTKIFPNQRYIVTLYLKAIFQVAALYLSVKWAKNVLLKNRHAPPNQSVMLAPGHDVLGGPPI